jgi:crotonobetainyl-CoA:carnitine CoA-transferase CaiB-like acyl-CoA transferase
MGEPLEGIRVVEIGVGVAAPIAGVYLADMGAEVIKIEPPGGDATRTFRGVHNTLSTDAPTPWLFAVNRGKKSFELDLGTEDGQEAAHRLVKTADVFLTNHRDEGLAHMGLDYETVHEINPRLVYAVSSGFGHRGPDARAAMLDLAAQARGGLCNVIGPPDEVPMVVGTVIADTAAGMLFSLAIMTALVARERTGVGQRVDTSALGAQLFLQAPDIDQGSMTGNALSREGRFYPNIGGLTGLYATADGRGVVIGRIPPSEWEGFCRFSGATDLIDHPLWGNAVIRAGLGGIDADANELRRLLGVAMASHTLAEWREYLTHRSDIVWAVAQNYDEVLADPQVTANDYAVDVDIPHVGPRRLVGNVVELSDTRPSPKTNVSSMGEHTYELLVSLGYTVEEIAGFAAQLDVGYRRLANRAGYTEKELTALRVPKSAEGGSDG